ncbi:MAG TPA: hypothetical protein DCZ71_09415 [Ruminococcus sp.]|nr:hypothetical protein [Ruminococcus sp.]
MGRSKHDKELEKAYRDLKEFERDAHKNRNELLSFFCGLLMFAAGLFLIFQNTVVTSSYGYGGFGFLRFGSFSLPNGMIMVPLIIGIAMLFLMDRKVFGWIVVAIGVIIILAAIISSVHIHWRTTNMYMFILMFGMVAAGGGMMLRELFRKD